MKSDIVIIPYINDQKRLIGRALELGINMIDSSSNYSNSEDLLGKCLSDIPRNTYHICTKWPARDQSGATITNSYKLTEAIDNSLKKLNLDFIDVMMLHGVLPNEYDSIVENLAESLIKAKESGKIGSIGLSTRFSVDPSQQGALEALQKHPNLWEVLMIKYGILNQHAANHILTLADRHDVGVMNMAAVRIKLPNPVLLEALIRGWKKSGLIPRDALPDKNPLDWLIQGDVKSVIEAGYRFAAEPPGIATVLTGTSSMEHLTANARCLENPKLTIAHSARLKALFGSIVEYA